MTASGEDSTTLRATIVWAGAEILVGAPLATVRLDDVAASAGLALAQVEAAFPSMWHLGAAVLDQERASMRSVQRRVAVLLEPSNRVIAAFRMVGENLATDTVVRAGVRIARESRESFPERRLDPFSTWKDFVRTQLQAESAAGRRIAHGVDRAAWLLVASGMGATDLIAFQRAWDSAPEILERTATDMLRLIVGRI